MSEEQLWICVNLVHCNSFISFVLYISCIMLIKFLRIAVITVVGSRSLNVVFGYTITQIPHSFSN